MRASELLAGLKGKPYGAYEAAVVEAARTGQIVGWPLMPLDFGRIRVRVASDYLSVGEPDDLLRTPLFPLTAQRIADALGMMLPTTRITTEIWRRATVRTTPTPMAPNLGPNLQQFADHSHVLDQNKASLHQAWGGLSDGLKKDIVVGKLLRPGKVIIFGWFWPDDPTVHGPYMTANLRASNPIQPYSDAHGDTYVDYSHGVRLVSRECEVDGVKRDLVDVLADPALAQLVSDEGVLTAAQSRYPAAVVQNLSPVVPYSYAEQQRTSFADRGLDVVRSGAAERKAEKP